MVVNDIRNKRKYFSFDKHILPWLLIAPALIGVIVIMYYPIFRALYMSFFKWSIMNPPGDFIGLDNYKLFLTSSFFHEALLNTVIIFVLGMIFGFWVPIIQAVCLNEIKKGQAIFRMLYLLPMIVPGVSTILLWRWIWDPRHGLANEILKIFGLGPFEWLNTVRLAKIALTFPGILGGGFMVIIYLAAIQGIPKEIYEVARIDGANFLQRVFYLTIPNIKNIIYIVFVLSVIGALQYFDWAFIMTAGGPAGSTTTLAIKIYNFAFVSYQFGLASSVGAFIFVLTIILVLIQFRLKKR